MIAERATAHQLMGVPATDLAATGSRAESIGLHVARYALVLVLVWIGTMKFTAYEPARSSPWSRTVR